MGALRLILFCLLAFNLSAATRTFYIDITAGADANNGTAKETAWAHQPYMPTFTGSYTHQAGDRFIFKGGEAWHKTNFYLNITSGGSSDNVRDYYGVDKTWYSGASWTRPKFDLDAQVPTNGWVIVFGASYVTVDSIHITNYYWTGSVTYPYQVRTVGNTYLTFTNMVFNGWTRQNHADGGGEGMCCIRGETTATTYPVLITGCLFDGERCAYVDSAGDLRTAGTAFYEIPLIHSNVFRYNTSAILVGEGNWALGNLCEVMNNLVEYNGVGFDDNNPDDPPVESGGHNNCIEQVGGTSCIVSNNIIRNSWGEVIRVGNPGTYSYIYNNVIYNVKAGNPIIMDNRGNNLPGGYPSERGSWIYNNSVSSVNDCVLGYADNPIWATNNHWIMTSPTNGWVGIAPNGSVLNHGYYLAQSTANAITAGYTTNNNLAPTASNSPTVGQGFAVAAVTTDRLGVSRGATYDIGAYEWNGGGETADANFTGTPLSGQAPLVVTFTDSSTGATSWSWTFGDGGVSALQNPTHTYTNSGTYTVVLSINSGADSLTRTGYVTVSVPPAPPLLHGIWRAVRANVNRVRLR